MRSEAGFAVLLVLLASVAWTELSLYFVIILEQPPALDPIGLLRTLALAPGYLAFLVAAALATAGIIMNPWVSGAIVGLAFGIVVSLTAMRVLRRG